MVAEELTRLSAGMKLAATSVVGDSRTRGAELQAVLQELNQDVVSKRLCDLAYNAIDVVDRNLYERSCDVRCWAAEPPVVAALRDSGADVIAMQELNSRMAAAIQEQLTREYPFQVLDPRDTDSGMGVISRYPFRRLNEQLSGAWLGQPQALSIDVQGVSIRVLNMHAMSPRFKQLEWTVRERERQARAIPGSRRNWLITALRQWLAAQHRRPAEDLREPGTVQ